MADLGSAVGSILLNYQGGPAVAQAKSDLAGLESAGARIGAGLALGGAVISKAGQQVTGVLGAGLQMATDFEFAIDGVNAALGGLDADTLGRIEEQALDLGASTRFSANEIAGVQQTLAKSGLSAENVLGGATQAVADLSAATGESLEPAAAAAAAALNLFGLEGDQVAGVADTFTAGLNNSSATLSDFRTGVNSLGSVMTNLNRYAGDSEQAFTDTAAAVAYFNAQGLKAADAGLSLARGMTDLATPTSKASEQMAALGISAFDANGDFLPLPELFDSLNTAMSGMSDGARESALANIFGAEAADVMNQAIKNGGDGLREYEELMVSQGQAAEQAALRQDNLASALEQLGGAVESLGIKMFTPFLDGLKSMVDGISAAINAFANLPAGILQAIATIAGVAGLVAAIGGAAIAAAGGVLLFNAALAGTGLTLGALLGPLALVAAAIAALAIAYQTNFLGFADAINSQIAKAQKAVGKFGSVFGAAFDASQAAGINGLASAVYAFGAALNAATGIDITGLTGQLALGIDALGDGFANAVANGMNPFAAALAGIANAAGALGFADIQNGLVDAASAAQRFGDVFEDAFLGNVAAGRTGVGAAVDALGNALSQVLGIDVSGVFDTIANGIDAVAGAAQAAADAIRSGIGAALQFLTNNVLPGAISALGNFLGTIKDIAAELLSGDFSQAGRIAGNALASLGEFLGNAVQGLGDALGSIDFGAVASTIASALGNALSGIGDFLSGVSLGNIASSVATAIDAALDGIGGFLVNAATTVGNALGSALGAIGSFITTTDFPGLLQSVSGALLSLFNAGGEWLSTVAANIGTQLGQALAGIGDSLGEIDFGALITTIGDAIGAAFETAGEFLSGVPQAIGTALGTALSTVGNFLGTLNFGSLVTTVTSAITAAFGGGGGGAQHVGSGQVGGGGAFAGIAQSIGAALGSALSTIGDFVGDIDVSGAVETVRSAIEGGFNGMQFNLDALATNLAAAVEAACGVDLSGAFAAIESAVSTALTAVGEFATVIGTYIDRIQEALAGIEVPEGLTNFATTIGDLATQLATGVADKITAVADAIGGIDVSAEISGAITAVGSAFKTMAAALSTVDIGAKIQEIKDAIATFTMPEGLDTLASVIAGIGTAAANAVKGVVDFFAALAGGVGEKAGQAGEVAGQTLTGIEDAINNANQAVFGASDQAKAAVGASGDIATNFINNVAASFANADWSLVSNAINTGMQAVLSGGFAGQGGPRDMGPSEGAGVGSTFATGFIQKIVAGFTPEAFAPVKAAFDAGLQAALAGGGGGGGEGGGIGQTVGLQLMTDLGAAIGKNTATVVAAMQAALQTVGTAIATGTVQWVTEFTVAFTNIASVVTSGMTTVTTAVTSGMAAINASITAATAQMTAAFTSAGAAMSAAMAAAMAAVTAAVTSGMASAVAAVQSGVAAIQAALQSAAAGAESAGAAVGAGFAAGISSQIGAVEAAAANLANAATSALNAAAQVASPSKITTETGEEMGSGLEAGLTNSVPTVAEAAAQLAEAIRAQLAQTIPLVEAVGSEVGTAFGGSVEESLSLDTATDQATDALADPALAEEAAAAGAATGAGFGDAMAQAMLGRMTLGGDGIGGEAIRAILGQLGGATAAVAEAGQSIGQTMGEGLNAGLGAAIDPLAMIPEGVGRDMAAGLIESVKSRQAAYLPQMESLLAERNRHAADLQDRGQPIHITVVSELDGREIAHASVEATIGGMLQTSGRNPSTRRQR